MRLFYLILTIIILQNCYSGANEKKLLNKNQALKLAVKISNKECNDNFGVSPFDTNSFEIEYKNGYWVWGELDVSGIDGYSVITKFDKYGKNDTVEVFFSDDRRVK